MKPHNYAVIFLPLVILLTNFVVLMFSTGFYESEFEKLGVYGIVEKERADAEVKNLHQYFIGKEETLHTTLFSAKERIHLLEVRALLRKGMFLWISIAVVFALLLLLHPNLYRVFFWGANATLVLILLSLFILPLFSQAFLNMHLIFFEDDSWQLEPGKDALLTLFPEQFFRDFFVRWMINSALASIAIASLTLLLRKFKNKKA